MPSLWAPKSIAHKGLRSHKIVSGFTNCPNTNRSVCQSPRNELTFTQVKLELLPPIHFAKKSPPNHTCFHPFQTVMSFVRIRVNTWTFFSPVQALFMKGMKRVYRLQVIYLSSFLGFADLFFGAASAGE